MLFRQLEYFVALARERHFARAASACYVSQPALSEAIRKLERELDVPLVLRGSSFEGLTPEGERLVPWARRILADRDALEHEVTALRTGLTGELTLGVIPAAATSATQLTDPFCAAHPLVRVRMWAGLRSADVVERIRRFELDAGIIYPDGIDADGLTVTPLYTDRHVVLAHEDLLPEGDGALSWSDAAQLPMCLLHSGMRGRDLIDEVATAHGVRFAPRLESDSVATLVAMVGAGRWATIVPRAWLATYRAPSDTRVVELAAPPGELGDRAELAARVALVRQAGEPESVLARALADSAPNGG
ncbi:Transcriptional regulator, LysR family OS=Tsukamurella paurometabola (strain ATCC 8368 / DSM/ CCUG 35730 / CIP 100753 / JCM 10117 / KCTC 9821 / NBRC 16120/ NCIMB 702349 / NCTC 13040) OX=521096 GN=Tpau_3197 PE=3 SV=1 [Tsukamurella paurometabola]|uniref:Transcriptional regulator, LysR family n=1 Tax=Tsukamurella paurometabola (strain ATCC 8368 / DSM 20162 / CCUG 35730 / CIP 100753 / JCM 10117 / KCTC 9821 / NBRC 16120 / NCIMB 702349 / NCTC 13040) TaxID=521096 RepID=D5UVK2_TSUPD|nr:LysR family transcriptional regulator [Tsukamurella paurometabola]ADG79784.1 transcriptional regulator, LysR family [Tsukamurella paurometabola DSM 20162]SUP37209.1 Morphology and auto-aggregation control protein [Tsukamurella paurometabola]